MHCFGAKLANVFLKLLALVGLALATPALAQHTSTECPPQSATVSSGGTVTIDITDCASIIGFAGLGDIDGGSYGPADFEDHGAATTRITGGRWFLDYSHNGTTGIGSTDIFEITEGDGNGDVRVTITINASASPITVLPGTLPELRAGTVFSQTLTASGGLAPYTYSLQSGALPPGVTLSNGGALSGTPTQRGAYSFSVRASDATSPTAQFVDKGYTGSVQNPVLSLATTSGTAVQGVSFSQALATNGGVAPYVYQIETGSLPSGITLSSAGVLNGTTNAAAGNYPVTIRVTDSSTGPGVYFELESFTLTVSPPPSVSISVSPASVSEDGTTNLTYTVTRSFATPGPVTVNLAYSGTATSGTDYTGASATIVIPANATSATLTIDPVADTAAEPDETVIVTIAAGSGYSIGSPASATGTITNDEGTSIYCPTLLATVAWGGSVSINAGSCNAGFGLGVVLTPPVHGTATVGAFGANQPIIYTHNGASGTTDTFTVNDGEAPPNNQIRVNVTITPPTSSIVVNPASLPTITAGANFSQALSATGGTGPYSWTVSGGTIPPGLALSSGGVISGTATQRGAYNFTVRAQDSLGAFSEKGYSGTVAVPTLAITPSSATGIQNVPFSLNIAASGGVAPYSFLHEVVGGALPPGMSLSSTGVLSGTPTTIGTTNFQIRVTDSSTGTGSYFELENFSFTVSAPPSVSIAVSPASLSEDGATNATFTVTRSLNLSSPTTVNISTFGTATSGSDYSGGVASVTIPAGATTATIVIDPTVDATVEPDETVTLSIAAGTGYTVGSPSIATATILNDDVPSASIAVSPASTAENGAGNLVYTVTLDAAPNSPTSVNYTVTGTATSGTDYAAVASPLLFLTGETSKTITIDPTADSTIETDETVIITLNPGTGYSVGAPNAATGTITNDDFPALSINDVTLVEGNSGTTNAVFTVSLSASSPQTVTVNYATANGTATQPADYSNTSGSLTFAPSTTTQTITVPVIGETVPEADETFFINLSGAVNATITDGQGLGTITNDDVPVTVSPASLPNGTVATTYSQTITASGGTAPYGFAVTAGSLPTGLTLSSGGTLAGTPTAGGTFNFTVTATDAAGAPGPFSGSQAYTVTIATPTIALPATTLANGRLGQAYTASITAATGGTAPYAYAVSAGALPGGLTLNPASGEISGTPSAPGSFAFSITATDSSTGTGPYSASQSYAIEVVDIPPVANPVSMTVPYDAGATNVPVSITGGTATSYGEVTSPAHGTVITLGTVITYQPSPGYAGPDSFTYNASNSGGTSAPATVTITVSDPLISVSASGSLAAVVGAPYTQTFSWTGGTAPFSGFQVTGLPAGLAITGTTANSVTISGTPTQAGSFSLNASASDSSTGNGPFAVGQSFTLTVAPPSLNLAPGAGVLTAAYGTPFSQSFTASGGIGGYSYSITGTLPPGLSLAGDTIAGTPTTPGSYNISITATDIGATGPGAPFSVTQAYTIDVPSPTIVLSPTALANGTAAVPYVQTITASGGVTPLTFTLGSGTLPAGISLSTGGALSGTPTEAGSFTFSVIASDANGQSGSRSFTVVIDGPALSLAPVSGALTLAYGGTLSQGFSASGGNGPYTYAISGALPAGVTFDPGSGLLSGSTFVVGDFAFTVTATDTGTSGASAPFTVTQGYTLRVTPPTLQITPGSLPGATVATSYTATLAASGGAAPYSFTVTGGALPTGLNLSPAGVISGTPSAGGTFTFTVTASDSGPAPGPFTVSRAYTLEVAAPVVVLPSTTLPAGQRGSAYSATLNPATGGTAPYTYAVTSGALPAGLALSSGGSLTGTPTVFGNFSFAVTATDSSTGNGPYTATQSYTLAIIADPPVADSVTVTLPYGAPSTPIALNLTGGPASSVTVQSGPANGSASVSGTVLSYQPRAGFSGTDSLTYTASNDGGTSAPATITITVSAPSLSVTASGPLDAVVGAPYTQTFSFAGGSAPFRSPEVTGLPAGLALTGTTANSVTISGTPRAQGTFTLSVSAADSSTGNGPFTASQTFSLTVAGPDLALTPATGTFSASYAAPFSQTFAASGGIGAYSYAVSGTLPAGMALDRATGILSGSPTQTGSFAFTITATDTGASGPGAPFTVAGSYTLNVAAPTIIVSPTALPNASSGTAYNVSLTGSGAVAPYTFTITGGALPAGLTLAPGGQIAGTPTASGNFPFDITVRDANGQTSQARLTLTVDVPSLTVTPATLPNAVQGVAYSQTLTVSGGIAPYRFSIGSGSLPAGLSLDPVRGIISGTPTGSGVANFAVTVTDSTGGTPASATVAYSLQITARPDPARDPEVRGLTQAQVFASRRFADTQVNNFMRRLESLHGNARSTGGFQNGLRLTGNNYCEDTVTSWTNEICRKAAAQPSLRAQNVMNAGEAARGAGSGPVAAERPWTVWTGGTIRFGERDPATGIAGKDFESEGLSLGADYRFSPSFAAGLGIGFGRDTTNVGENQSRSSGEATTIAIYGSHQLGGGIFLDWLGGYQWLDFDLRRYVTSTGALINSNRSGNQWFVTGSAGADIATGNWQFTPYARVDVRRGTLNGYIENSGSLFDLRFLDQDVDFTSLGLGTVINYQHRLRHATLLPSLRIQYLYDVERSAEARVAYADLVSGPFSAIPLTGMSREQLTLGLGTEVLFDEALSLEVEYLGRIASGSGSDHALQAGVSLKF